MHARLQELCNNCKPGGLLLGPESVFAGVVSDFSWEGWEEDCEALLTRGRVLLT